MAFDAHVGTLTRFYRREWENVAQRMARTQGLKYEKIYAGGKPEDPPAADEIRQAVTDWCSALTSGLKGHGVEAVSWDERDDQPYFTERPGYDGYGAMLLWAA